MTKIPQLISSTEVAKKLGISKETLSRLGFTKYKFNARIIRYSEAEITLWLEKRATTDESKFNVVESCTQLRLQKSAKPRSMGKKSSKTTEIDELAKLLNVRLRKPY